VLLQTTRSQRLAWHDNDGDSFCGRSCRLNGIGGRRYLRRIRREQCCGGVSSPRVKGSSSLSAIHKDADPDVVRLPVTNDTSIKTVASSRQWRLRRLLLYMHFNESKCGLRGATNPQPNVKNAAKKIELSIPIDGHLISRTTGRSRRPG
jgi:hypothetical protein